jgi:preprotein translocase subunit SecY
MSDDLREAVVLFQVLGVETSDYLDKVMSLITFRIFISCFNSCVPNCVSLMDVQQSWAMFLEVLH